MMQSWMFPLYLLSATIKLHRSLTKSFLRMSVRVAEVVKQHGKRGPQPLVPLLSFQKLQRQIPKSHRTLQPCSRHASSRVAVRLHFSNSTLVRHHTFVGIFKLATALEVACAIGRMANSPHSITNGYTCSWDIHIF